MSDLQVENRDGVLIVDSRLLTEALEIEHRTLLTNIKNHESTIVEAFGAVTFEMLPRSDGNSGGSQAQMCWLTEDQATFVMTLSRNSEAVVRAKVNLVKAFSKTKEALTTLLRTAFILKLKRPLECFRLKCLR
jgi:phage regulator Rha-like protein